ncbi:Suppressor of cytokine signaling 3 [Labeo rohita]|uniref:Suppressor of cytokine signaling 3 n=1 Tax=Labeo rohita TaxID=84645 RepID=A0ABQ8MV21_LABRO|nr:Suppressor of cytokine signaling 3 [Labeo rohita]
MSCHLHVSTEDGAKKYTQFVKGIGCGKSRTVFPELLLPALRGSLFHRNHQSCTLRGIPGSSRFVRSAMVTHSKFDNAMSSSLFDANMRLPSHRYKTFSSKLQYQMVQHAVRMLQESGFYWGSISGKEANHLLNSEPSGTFLVRDSSDNRHFFTLSVKTESGTKNLRVQCDNKSFFLQTDSKSMQSVPRFDCVLKLVHHYMPSSRSSLSIGNSRNSYYIYTGGEKIPLELLRPLPCTMSSLQHLCRKTVNGHIDVSSKRDQLPQQLKDFLQDAVVLAITVSTNGRLYRFLYQCQYRNPLCGHQSLPLHCPESVSSAKQGDSKPFNRNQPPPSSK